MMMTPLVVTVAPRTDERGEHFLQNSIFHFVFRFSQFSEIALKS